MHAAIFHFLPRRLVFAAPPLISPLCWPSECGGVVRRAHVSARQRTSAYVSARQRRLLSRRCVGWPWQTFIRSCTATATVTATQPTVLNASMRTATLQRQPRPSSERAARFAEEAKQQQRQQQQSQQQQSQQHQTQQQQPVALHLISGIHTHTHTQ